MWAVKFLIRVAITVVILINAYPETGPWTVTSFALCFVYFEINGLFKKMLVEKLKGRGVL